MSTIFLGADHGGFELKQDLLQWLNSLGYQVEDCGAYELDPADDYPDVALMVAEQVAADETAEAKGIIICRSSAGVVMAANKVIGIRAVAALNPDLAKMSRQHNDSNVLGLGADVTDVAEAREIVSAFLETPFSQDERHVRRLAKIAAYEVGEELEEEV